jgi:catechol 2,3-dioxygenase
MNQPVKSAAEAPFEIHPATTIGLVHLTVANLESQIDFYRTVLGFKLHWRDGASAGLGGGGEDLLLLTEDPEAGRARGTTGLYHFAVLYPDLKALARAIARLFALRYTNYPTDHVMTKTTYLDDPEGNGIELYADTPDEGTWAIVNDDFVVRDALGNLRSGREPLDIRELFSRLTPDEDLDAPIPPGTRIGHIHLHVSNIEDAVAFYHNVLGFEIQLFSLRAGVGFVSAGGYHHHIGLNTWLGAGAPAPAPGALGLRYFTVVLPGQSALDKVTERIQAAGIQLAGTGAEILVTDPSRNGIMLKIEREKS